MNVRAEGDTLTLRFPQRWLCDHPLTEADLRQEQGFLLDGGISLDFA